MDHAKLFAALVLLFLPFANGCASFKKLAYEGFGRDRWQHPEEVIRVLQIKPGSRVADLGAGGGYFTFRLADAVGPNGRVYAVDIDPDMLGYLQERAEEEGRRNVEVVTAVADDAHLPVGSVDLLFTCDTYHHLEDRTRYFGHVKASLAPDGRVAIIDHNGSGWFAWLFGHYTPADVIEADMSAAGYRLEQRYTFLPRQNFLVFSAN